MLLDDWYLFFIWMMDALTDRTFSRAVQSGSIWASTGFNTNDWTRKRAESKAEVWVNKAFIFFR